MKAALVIENDRDLEVIKRVLERASLYMGTYRASFDVRSSPSTVNVVGSQGKVLGYIAIAELEAILKELGNRHA